jgi:CheY-like chemotaxis protein
MDRQQFVNELRVALMHLDDFNSLRRNPLLPLLCPADRNDSPVALQTRLVTAIAALREEPGPQAARFADILFYRYVEHLGASEVAFQMGVSERQLRREQTNAIELLAERLWPGVVQPDNALPPSTQTASPDRAISEANREALTTEVNWLRQQFSTESCQIDREWAKARQEAQTLAQKYGVTLPAATLQPGGPAALPPLALRQALLTVLTTLIPHAEGGTVTLAQTVTPIDRQLTFTVRSCRTTQPFAEADRAALDIAHQLLLPFGGAVSLRDTQPLTLCLTAPMLASVPILVVDDNPDAGQLFQRYVVHSRFRLLVTSEPSEAIALIQEHNVQAVVLDIMMPKLDGWDLLAQLRHHPASQHLPIAICSILPQQELSHLLGARLFIPKPVSQSQFLAALQTLTASPATTPASMH